MKDQIDAEIIGEGLAKRRAARQAAERGWIAIRLTAQRLAGERCTVVNAIDQHLLVRTNEGREIKLWRKGDDFAIAVDGKVSKVLSPDGALRAVVSLIGGGRRSGPDLPR